MTKLILTLFTIFAILSITLAYYNQGPYDEISDEEFAEYEVRYVNENDASEKKYLEAVVKPEKFDLNKDRKISKEEIREALKYVVYPKDQKAIKGVPDEVKVHLINNIDLFVKHLTQDYFNFKQFSYLMRRVNLNMFMNPGVLKDRLNSKKQQVEGEGDL